MIPWNQIQSSPEYPTDPASQRLLKDRWFRENIAPSDAFINLNQVDRDRVTSTFFGPIATSEAPEQSYNIFGGLKDVANLIQDVPINLKGAFASMFEDDNPEAEYDWKDIARQAQEERNKVRSAERGGEEYVLPWVQREDIREAAASTGFTGVALGAGVAGGLAAAPIPIPGTRVAGALVASGAAAYRIDKTVFTQRLIDAFRQNLDHELTDQEVSDFVEKTRGLRTKHALWEAIPEAVGNVAQLTGIGALFRAALGKNLGVKILKTVAGMYGVEVATETITQTGQQNVEIEAGISEGQKRSFASLEDMHRSFKEVAPSVFVLVSLTGGAGAVGAKTYQLVANPKSTEDASIINPIVNKFNKGEATIQETVTDVAASDVSDEAKESALDIITTFEPIGRPETAEEAARVFEEEPAQAPAAEAAEAFEGQPDAIQKAARARQRKIEKTFLPAEQEADEIARRKAEKPEPTPPIAPERPPAEPVEAPVGEIEAEPKSITVFHGSAEKPIGKLKTSTSELVDIRGVFFTQNKEVAGEIAKQRGGDFVGEYIIKPKNIADEKIYNEIEKMALNAGIKEPQMHSWITSELLERGFDAVKIERGAGPEIVVIDDSIIQEKPLTPPAAAKIAVTEEVGIDPETLKDFTISQKVTVEETGKVVTIKRNTKEAYLEATEKKSTFNKFLECLAS